MVPYAAALRGHVSHLCSAYLLQYSPHGFSRRLKVVRSRRPSDGQPCSQVDAFPATSIAPNEVILGHTLNGPSSSQTRFTAFDLVLAVNASEIETRFSFDCHASLLETRPVAHDSVAVQPCATCLPNTLEICVVKEARYMSKRYTRRYILYPSLHGAGLGMWILESEKHWQNA
ncbi:hypothetical protein CSAL01_06387 [Colletotrichum salicis]|uniref:Uncharacterized protein n=1 Tax=Colletotrichum salicis TaxID=1209931 RepID=A0A135UH56_9PEZI|nr:hypothetical protein CSAL01_06387 [Colletotrichum salicis]